MSGDIGGDTSLFSTETRKEDSKASMTEGSGKCSCCWACGAASGDGLFGRVGEATSSHLFGSKRRLRVYAAPAGSGSGVFFGATKKMLNVYIEYRQKPRIEGTLLGHTIS